MQGNAAASKVHQAYHENNMTPIYETINIKESDDNNFGIYIDTITKSSDEPEDAHYENIHSREIKCCHNSSTEIDTAANVAYYT